MSGLGGPRPVGRRRAEISRPIGLDAAFEVFLRTGQRLRDDPAADRQGQSESGGERGQSA